MLNEIDAHLYGIGGAFSPEQMSIFLNMSYDKISEHERILFHEKFHHWQFLFTPYGQLKWGYFRTSTSEIIKIWLKATDKEPHNRKLPIGNLLKNGSKENIKDVSLIYIQELSIKLIGYEERFNEDADINKLVTISEKIICPEVIINGRAYKLNGIDIIESFAKFQEAVFAHITDTTSFFEIINPSKLNKEYYIALLYFIEQLGAERITEFPIACELSLSASKLCRFSTEDFSWKDNHPAWRFINITNAMKSSKFDTTFYPNIKKNFNDYCNSILTMCNYENVETMWCSAIEYTESSELRMSQDMLEAINIKMKYPWFLSFPFIETDIFMETKINDLQPYYLITNDNSGYYSENNLFLSEVVFEGNYQAFANQICGKMSDRCIYPDLLQCGFSYYKLQGCKYFDNDLCNGHIDLNNNIDSIELDKDGNLTKGCPFEFILLILGLKVEDLKFSNINDKVCFDDIEKKKKSNLSKNS